MSTGYGTNPTYRSQGELDPRVTEGVLGRRLGGYLVDLLVIALLMGVLGVIILILGVVTFGFGWGLFALVPLTAIVYNALTLGGRSQATFGMRMVGIRAVDMTSGGGRVSLLQAAVHALLFWVAASTGLLLAADIILGFARSDRRLGHDLLSGVALVRLA